MKVTRESESRMVLKDHKYSTFAIGAVFLVIGVGVAYFLSSQGIALAFGAIFALVGLLLMVSTRMVTIVLDKGAGKLSISMRSILKNESSEAEISKIKGVVLQKDIGTSRTSHTDSGRTYQTYQTYCQYTLKFVLDAGNELSFDFGKVNMNPSAINVISEVVSSPDEGKRKDAQQVADFLDVPLKEVGPASISDAMSAIKEGIAEGMERAAKVKKGGS